MVGYAFATEITGDDGIRKADVYLDARFSDTSFPPVKEELADVGWSATGGNLTVSAAIQAIEADYGALSIAVTF